LTRFEIQAITSIISLEGVAKEWCEILDGKDALAYDYKDKVVVSNPPYSIRTKCLKKMTNDGATVISLLTLVIHITIPRIISKSSSSQIQLSKRRI
jgi:16S rRNA A1518/A1519 N6-dimethyltransferase RsmA/KsgA/DIM1 with predicted DNA glycosylase/AP lyase activity